MITLITGTPGSGKTAYVVSQMMKRFDNDPDTLFFVDGIKNLQLPHSKLPPVDEWTIRKDDPDSLTGEQKPFYQFPAGSIIIIDECQYTFRPRSAGSPVPDHVAALETHRHTGIDFWLITQRPMRLDNVVRGLVKTHIHLLDSGILGRHLYEWVDRIGDPENKSSKEIAAKRKYKLPKKAFNMYTSSELHTKSAQRIPSYVYVAALAVLSLIGSVFYIWNTIDKKLNPHQEEQSFLSSLGVEERPKTSSLATSNNHPNELSYMEAFEPRISGLPHTAPVYDTISYAPQSAPFPAACVDNGTDCYCYTNQATKIAMEDNFCRVIVKNGLYDLSRAPLKPSPARLKDSPDLVLIDDAT